MVAVSKGLRPSSASPSATDDDLVHCPQCRDPLNAGDFQLVAPFLNDLRAQKMARQMEHEERLRQEIEMQRQRLADRQQQLEEFERQLLLKQQAAAASSQSVEYLVELTGVPSSHLRSLRQLFEAYDVVRVDPIVEGGVRVGSLMVFHEWQRAQEAAVFAAGLRIAGNQCFAKLLEPPTASTNSATTSSSTSSTNVASGSKEAEQSSDSPNERKSTSVASSSPSLLKSEIISLLSNGFQEPIANTAFLIVHQL
jgi:hypothetical protein